MADPPTTPTSDLRCPAPSVIARWCAGRHDPAAACRAALLSEDTAVEERTTADAGVPCQWLAAVSCDPDALPF